MSSLTFFKNKSIALAIFVSCILFIVILAIEKTRVIFKMTPMIRGEVALNNLVITTTKDGSPLIINKDDPSMGEQLRVFGNVRSRFNSVISAFYNNNSVVVEIGPQYGYNTISLARGLKAGGKLYAFEANSQVCSALRKSLVLNDLDDIVTIKNVAIADHKGHCNISDCVSIKEISNGVYSQPRMLSAKCSTLDEEMDNEDRPVDLVAVDIPDMEIQILKSCRGLIDRSPDIVLILTFDNDPVNPEAKKEFRKLMKKGMNFYVATEKEKYTKITDINKLLKQKQVILIITRRDLIQ